MAPEMVKELRALQKENAQLKKLVAEQALDNQILKEAVKGNWTCFLKRVRAAEAGRLGGPPPFGAEEGLGALGLPGAGPAPFHAASRAAAAEEARLLVEMRRISARRPRFGSPRVHVKCAAVDGEWLFLSSANLTQQAFTINVELGVLVRGGTIPVRVERTFERLIASGDMIRV